MIRRLLVIGGFIAVSGATVLAVDALYPPDLHRFKDLSRTVVAADGTILRVVTSTDQKWRLPTRLDHVDPRYIAYLIAYEDKRFWTHHGVDPLAIARALGQWSGAGRIVSGASTLTMQVARLLEPRRRTVLSKAIEMFRAIQLESRLSKKEILSIYLTLAPFGGNIEGVRTASLAYFNKPPRRLTVAEAALLVALPQSPSRYRPDRRRKNAAVARAKVLKRLRSARLITPRQASEADDTPIGTRRHRLPFRAPHMARRLFSEYPDAATVRSHIVPQFQAAVADIDHEAIRPAGHGVNAAAMVVENETSKVLVYVASSGFFDESRTGQIDYIRAVRSPGSALKPFIYAMAFDEGIAHPETFIADRRKRFGGYRPANFDGLSHGRIIARHALQASLNVPAVTLLHELGPRRFLSRLHGFGIRPKLGSGGGGPGLAVALGGAGLSLEQLVAMYSALARGRGFKGLSFSKGRNTVASAPFYDPTATAAVVDILAGTPRPRGRYGAAADRRIAFKTGTSSGYRDVLALGFDGTYTVGVWMGHPDAKPMPAKTGARTAAPILFRIFDVLPAPTGKISARMAHVARDKAPMNLKTLLSVRKRSDILGSAPFSISFPPDGSVIPFRQRDSGSAVVTPVRMRDGKRPFNVFVNGAPVRIGSLGRSVAWRAETLGFYAIVAIDREGNIAASNFELSDR